MLLKLIMLIVFQVTIHELYLRQFVSNSPLVEAQRVLKSCRHNF